MLRPSFGVLLRLQVRRCGLRGPQRIDVCNCTHYIFTKHYLLDKSTRTHTFPTVPQFMSTLYIKKRVDSLEKQKLCMRFQIFSEDTKSLSFFDIVSVKRENV